ncbi:MAG: hypothetical protein ACKVQW_14770 [Pyrinomonadaceae bacterium]
MSELLEYRKILIPLLQLRPDALARFDEIVASGNIVTPYYDLSNDVTPAIFIVIERDGEETQEVIRLEGLGWRRPS